MRVVFSVACGDGPCGFVPSQDMLSPMERDDFCQAVERVAIPFGSAAQEVRDMFAVAA